jgi:hypothetical protein
MSKETKIEIGQRLLVSKLGKHLKKDILDLLAVNGCSKDVFYAMVKAECIRSLSIEYCEITPLMQTMSDVEISKFRYAPKDHAHKNKFDVKEIHKKQKELMQRHGAVASKNMALSNDSIIDNSDVPTLTPKSRKQKEIDDAVLLLKANGYKVMKLVARFEEV